MPNTVKMVAVVDGDEVTVGRCHPGQARILRKQGLAEWRDGKVVLNEAPATAVNANASTATLESHRAVEIVRDEDGNAVALEGGPPGHRVTVQLTDGWGIRAEDVYPVLRRPLTASVHHDLARRALEEDIAEIDPEGVFSQSHQPIEFTTCEDVEVYVREIVQRRAAGHSLVPCDDPRSRMIGFIDDDEEVGFEIPLVSIKSQVNGELWTTLGDPETPVDLREAFKATRSRNAMLGYVEREAPEMDDEELSRIWESAPRCDLNPFVGVPAHDDGTDTVKIPVRGLDPSRVMAVAGRAIVGRSPEPRGRPGIAAEGSPPSRWGRFEWPGDANLVGTLRDGTIWPSMGTRMLDGYFRRTGKHLLRVVHTWEDCWWDVSELRDWSDRYHVIECQDIDRSEGAWWDLGRDAADRYLEGITPSGEESP